MKKDEYLRRLRKGLSRLPKEELEAAVSYYEEIFLDAGEENEEQTAEELGDVDEVIRRIYVENNIDPDGRPEQPLSQSYNAYNTYTGNAQQSGGGSTYTGKATKAAQAVFSNTDISSVIVKVLILLITSPLWIPLLSILFAVVVALVCVAAAIVAVIVILILCMGFVGVILFAVGIRLLFAVPWLGLLTSGGGLVLVGLFLIIIVPGSRAVFKGLLALSKALFGKLSALFQKLKRRSA